jgi:hypothetical protein
MNVDPSMLRQSANMMKNMSPEQLKSMTEMAKKMYPDGKFPKNPGAFPRPNFPPAPAPSSTVQEK